MFLSKECCENCHMRKVVKEKITVPVTSRQGEGPGLLRPTAWTELRAFIGGSDMGLGTWVEKNSDIFYWLHGEFSPYAEQKRLVIWNHWILASIAPATSTKIGWIPMVSKSTQFLGKQLIESRMIVYYIIHKPEALYFWNHYISHPLCIVTIFRGPNYICRRGKLWETHTVWGPGGTSPPECGPSSVG